MNYSGHWQLLITSLVWCTSCTTMSFSMINPYQQYIDLQSNQYGQQNYQQNNNSQYQQPSGQMYSGQSMNQYVQQNNGSYYQAQNNQQYINQPVLQYNQPSSNSSILPINELLSIGNVCNQFSAMNVIASVNNYLGDQLSKNIPINELMLLKIMVIMQVVSENILNCKTDNIKQLFTSNTITYDDFIRVSSVKQVAQMFNLCKEYFKSYNDCYTRFLNAVKALLSFLYGNQVSNSIIYYILVAPVPKEDLENYNINNVRLSIQPYNGGNGNNDNEKLKYAFGFADTLIRTGADILKTFNTNKTTTDIALINAHDNITVTQLQTDADKYGYNTEFKKTLVTTGGNIVTGVINGVVDYATCGLNNVGKSISQHMAPNGNAQPMPNQPIYYYPTVQPITQPVYYTTTPQINQTVRPQTQIPGYSIINQSTNMQMNSQIQQPMQR